MRDSVSCEGPCIDAAFKFPKQILHLGLMKADGKSSIKVTAIWLDTPILHTGRFKFSSRAAGGGVYMNAHISKYYYLLRLYRRVRED